MSKRLKRAASAAAAVIMVSSAMTGVYSQAGFNVNETEPLISKSSRNSLPSEASVSYAVPKFDCIIGREIMDFTDLSPVAAYEPLSEAINISGSTEALPATYDLRKEGLASIVENQNPYGICWTYASSSSAVSSLMESSPSVNLSEWHTAFYPYYGNDQIKVMDPITEGIFDHGGTVFIVTNLWSQWKGPVNSNVLEKGNMDICSDSKLADSLAERADYHLENAYMFDYAEDGSNREEINGQIKQFLYNNQMVDVSFCTDGYSYATNSAYTTNGPKKADHSVTIVGWDDSYTASNFEENTGAWIVKNSWGSHFGENGYFYISYEDASLCEFGVYELGEKSNYAVNYHHDTFVPTQTMSADDDPSINQPSYMANIFTAENTEQLEAVSLYINNPDTEYEVTVYTDLADESNPASGTASSVTKGSSELTGYITVELDENTVIEDGEKFAVSVKMYCADSKFVLPIETSMILEDADGGISDIGSLSTYDQICEFTGENESFYSENGEEWTDVTSENFTYTEEEKNMLLEQIIAQNGDELTAAAEENLRELFDGKTLKVIMGNLSLKAFSNPVDTVDFSHISGNVPLDESVSLSVKDGSSIYYSVNGGKYQEYTLPIAVTEEMTISATTDHRAYTNKTFTPALAELSAIGYTASSSDKKDMEFAERADASTYNIYVEGSCDELRIMPISSADITIDGASAETGAYTEFFPIEFGENVFEIQLEEADKLSNTVTLNIYREAVAFDLETETVKFDAVDGLYTLDGVEISDGDSVSAYAGQILRAEIEGSYIDVQVPERAVMPELEIDYLNETLNIISNDIADYVEYAVGENPDDSSFIPATERYIDGQNITSGMVMTKAFRIVPGETVTLRVAPGDRMFGSEATEYVIPTAEAAPYAKPEYTYADGVYTLEYSDIYEYGVPDVSYTDDEFAEEADSFGYTVEEYEALMSARYGISDHTELLKAMGIIWDTYFDIEAGEGEAVIAVRNYADYDSFASAMKYERLTELLMGDVDDDGEINAVDASMVLKYYAEVSTGIVPTVTEHFAITGDFDSDGKIDSSDASGILKYYAMKATGNL